MIIRLIQRFVFFATVAIVAAHCGWFDQYHALFGGVALLLGCLPVAYIRRRMRQQSRPGRPIRGRQRAPVAFGRRGGACRRL